MSGSVRDPVIRLDTGCLFPSVIGTVADEPMAAAYRVAMK